MDDALRSILRDDFGMRDSQVTQESISKNLLFFWPTHYVISFSSRAGTKVIVIPHLKVYLIN